MAEDARQVLGDDPFPLVAYPEAQLPGRQLRPHGQKPGGGGYAGHRLPGVGDQVDQDLQQARPVQGEHRELAELPAHADLVPGERVLLQAQRLLDQFPRLHRLDHPGAAGVALLGGDDLLDVLHAARQPGELGERRLLVGGQAGGEFLQVPGEELPLVVPVQVASQVVPLLVHELDRLGEPRHPGPLEPLHQRPRRDVHAV